MTTLGIVHHDGFSVFTLRRVARRNAIDHGLVDAVESAIADTTARGHAVAVLQADPPTFCAGADLEEFAADPHATPGTVRLVDLLLGSGVFWITVVEGAALGAGAAVAAVSPVVLATDHAEFRLPEVDLGIYPGGVLGYLEAVIGPRAAHDLALHGQAIDATRALALGLVSEVVASGEARTTAVGLAARLAARPRTTAHAVTSWTSRFTTTAFRARQASLDALVELPEGMDLASLTERWLRI